MAEEVEPGTREWAERVAEHFAGVEVGRELGDDRVQFREIATGRFTYASDIWDFVRDIIREFGSEEVVEELGG